MIFASNKNPYMMTRIGCYCTIIFLALPIGSVAAAAAVAVASNPFDSKQTPNSDKVKKVKHMVELMSKATPTRNSQLGRNLAVADGVEVGASADIDIDVDIDIDWISGYSLRFEKCQVIKAYDPDDPTLSTLITQRFVIFRLCPTTSNGNCGESSCNSSLYGEYMVNLEHYLDFTVKYHQEERDEMCRACQEECSSSSSNSDDETEHVLNEDEDANDEEEQIKQDGGQTNIRKLLVVDDSSYVYNNPNCDTCISACRRIDGMEDNFYRDATKYTKCQPIQQIDSGAAYTHTHSYTHRYVYAGPICASQGTKIKIGVFKDENCWHLDSSEDVQSYLTDENGNAFRLDHGLLKRTYHDCISCNEDNMNNVNKAQGDDTSTRTGVAASVKEVCTNLYTVSAKCEFPYGFDGILEKAKEEIQQAQCKVVKENCNCNYYHDEDDQGVSCLARCYESAGLDFCGENNQNGEFINGNGNQNQNQNQSNEATTTTTSNQEISANEDLI